MSFITWGLYFCFIASTLWSIIWALKRPDGVFQYPFLSGSVWLMYIGLQALGVLNNPQQLPPGVLEDYGIEKALFLATTCVLLGTWGYISGRSQPRGSSHYWVYSRRHLLNGGICLILLAWASFFKLASLTGGILNYYSVEGNYALDWSGLPVAYVFFVKLIYPGLAICLLETLRRPSMLKWAVVVMASAQPVANVLLLGRRTEVVLLALTVALALFFQKGWTPKQWLIITAMVFGAIMVIVAPAYRSYSQLGSENKKILTIDIKEMVLSQASGKEVSEFYFPVVQLAATDHAMEFNYGIGFYNRLVQEWVPALLVGRDFKNSLFLDAVDFSKHTLKYYRWLPQYGWIPTAIVDVYREFWYFGSFLFFFLGRSMKMIWVRAALTDSDYAKIFYMAIAPLAMISVISGITTMLSLVVYFLVFLSPIFLLAKKRKLSPRVRFGI